MARYSRTSVGRRSRWWIAVVLAGAAVAGSAAVILFVGPPREAPGGRRAGARCETSKDCPGHAVCAAGGCVLLLPSEFVTMWEEDAATQLDPALPWKPPAFFGEKLLPAEVCPAPPGTVKPPDEGHVRTLAKTTVFDFGGERPSVHLQLRVQGTMWFESLRFWLPPALGEGDPGDVCVSSGLPAAVAGGGRWRGRQAAYVDVSLSQAVPVGQEARAAVSVALEPPPADGEGYRTLQLGLDPVFDGAMERTAVALPLGADVAAIEGTPPARQRLLTGCFAYIWEHGDSPGETSVRFRLPARPGREVDLRELNP